MDPVDFNFSCIIYANFIGDPGWTTRRSTAECGVCFDEECEPHILNCCNGAMCKSCFEKVKNQRCPFCRKPPTDTKGNQPKGKIFIFYI